MLGNIKIYTSDKYWAGIFFDLGAQLVDSANFADVVFDDIDVPKKIYVDDLIKIILNRAENTDIISDVFGDNVQLSNLQRRLIVLLYKNPDINMHDLKNAVGISPDITSHAVETAVYELRKKYGRNIIQNTNGKYKIGKL